MPTAQNHRNSILFVFSLASILLAVLLNNDSTTLSIETLAGVLSYFNTTTKTSDRKITFSCSQEYIAPSLPKTVSTDPRFKPIFDSLGSRKKSTIEKLLKAQTNADKALQDLYQDNSFFCFVDSVNHKPLDIILIPESLTPDVHLGGLYNIHERKIGILFKDYLKQSDYLKILRNEFFHFLISTINTLNGASPQHKNILHPFINRHGEIDKERYTLYKNSLDDLKNKISSIFKILTSEEKLNKNQQRKLNEIIIASSNYTPTRFKINSDALFKLAVKQGLNTPTEKHGFFKSTVLVNKLGIPYYSGKKIGQNQYVYQHSRRFNNKKLSRFEALIGDLVQQIAALDNPDGPYKKHSEVYRYSELGSFIAQLPVAIMKQLAPLFYHYMREFYTQDLRSKEGLNKKIDSAASLELQN